MKIFAVCLFLLFASPVHAQNLPEMPKPKSHKVFYIGTAALGGAKTFDAASTVALVNRGGWESLDSRLGLRPSGTRMAGTAAADFAAESAVFYFTERNRRAWVRWSGRAFIGFLVEQHLRLGSCNLRINTHSTTVQTCH